MRRVLASLTRARTLGLQFLDFDNVTSGSGFHLSGKWLKRVLIPVLVIGAVFYEARTSRLQSRILSAYARRLSYTVELGPSPRIRFPKGGPFDARRGYVQIPEFEERLVSAGFHIAAQARFSPSLEWIARLGIALPYREAAEAGLVVRGNEGTVLHQGAPARRFARYDDIPPLVVRSLLEMENRELADAADAQTNPVVEWDRLARAGLLYAAGKLGLPVRREGGSTLATQLEKYRHSAGGRTASFSDKLLQMTGASLKVYREGRDTREPRREIILDYLNTVPLAAVPGYGELHGLGDGLKGWFGMELDEVCRDLDAPDPARRARAFKHTLALLAAVRAPTHYLLQDREGLEARMRLHVAELTRRGVIGPALARALDSAQLGFVPAAWEPDAASFDKKKAANLIRIQLLELLGVGSLYDLDRLHLDVQSTIDPALQDHVMSLFEKLHDPSFVAARGLRGERLLQQGDPAKVIYSLVLFERTPLGNALRVNADNLNEPMDLNSGLKAELGSTAKLRTLAHYLELAAAQHAEFSPLGTPRLRARAAEARDPITRWAAETLLEEPALDLDAFLGRALDRKYSASPGEAFFTGGGLHTFKNFDPKDNGRVLTVREATRNSTNLVFIRLMRDLVRYHQARLGYDAEAVLADPNHPERRRMLTEAADIESDQILARAYRSFRGLDREAILKRLLGTRARSSRSLAILYFAWHPGAASSADVATSLRAWLREHSVDAAPREIESLLRSYGNPRLTLLDYAYLLKRHPLDLACAGALLENPSIGWTELRARSGAARQAASSWLLSTRHRTAQDLRLRIHVEADAFARMTPYWRRLGFPFERLTSSYATAIGSSADRPIALAELMGIICNDGVRLPTIRLKQLRFAAGTPYHTVFEPSRRAGERVVPEAVARTLHGVLAGVVEGGTARRVAGAFKRPDGSAVVVGGKTGSGDNRFETFGPRGRVISTRVVNRTATFVFYIGERYFGVLLAYVPGEEAGHYRFTSALPVAILRLLAPQLNPYLHGVAPRTLVAMCPSEDIPPQHAENIGKVIGPDAGRGHLRQDLPARVRGQSAQVDLPPGHDHPLRRIDAVGRVGFTHGEIIPTQAHEPGVVRQVGQHRLQIEIPVGDVKREDAVLGQLGQVEP